MAGALLDQDGVAARDGDLLRYALRAADRPYPQAEPQGVRPGPGHLDQILPVEGIGVVPDIDEAHSLAMGAVRVGLPPGHGADDLLEDQDVAGCQRQRPLPGAVDQGGGRGPLRQAVVWLAPGPQGDAAVLRPDRDGLARHGFEDLVARQEPEGPGGQSDLRVGRQAGEGAGRAAVVHQVVDQPGVAAYRGPEPRGIQIGLRGDGVLLVAQLVTGVGEQFDKGDHEVGRVLLGP